MVFKGPDLAFGIHWELSKHNHTLLYENIVGLGLPFSKNILGINFCLKPIDFSYLWNISSWKPAFKVGPSVKMQYDVQFYPDLQSGYSYWLTKYSLGIKIATTISIPQGKLYLHFFNSFIGLTSRSEPYTDPYFFDLSFGEVLKDINSNFKSSGINDFKNTAFSIEYQSKKHSRISVSYNLEYSNYFIQNRFQLLTQSIRIHIKTKDKV